METSKLIVQIPEPCHEDWSRMRPEEKGRFCSSCSKTVIDFTGKTDTEIKEILVANRKSKVCGHFKSSQLNRPLQISIDLNNLPYNMSVTRKFAVVLLLVFGSMLVSCYDHDGKKVKINQIDHVTDGDSYVMGAAPFIEQTAEVIDGEVMMQPEDWAQLTGEVAIPEPIKGDVKMVSEPDRNFCTITGKIDAGSGVTDSTGSEISLKDSVVVNQDSNKVELIRETYMCGGLAWTTDEIIDTEVNVRDMVASETYFVDGEKVTQNVSSGAEVKTNFGVSPNPGNGWFSVSYELKKRADTRLNVFDMNGRLVQTIAVTNQQYEGRYQIPIDISSQPNGIYIVSFICDGILITKKIVKEP